MLIILRTPAASPKSWESRSACGSNGSSLHQQMVFGPQLSIALVHGQVFGACLKTPSRPFGMGHDPLITVVDAHQSFIPLHLDFAAQQPIRQ